MGIQIGARPSWLWAPVLLVLSTLAAPGGTVEVRRTVSEHELNRIQIECFRAYPRDLVSAVTDGKRQLPEELERSPEKVWGNVYPLAVEKGQFFPTILQEILPMFERYVTPGKRFLDLGSGDGRVVFLANLLGAYAHGIEYEKKLVEASLRAQSAISDLVDPSRIRFTNGDFFDSSWADYDVIFYFEASTTDQERFHRKVASELKPEGRLIVAGGPTAMEGLDLEIQERGVKVFRRASN